MKTKHKFSFLYRNGLSACFLLLMILSLSGQVYTGWREHNEFLSDYGKPPQALAQYFLSGHFLQATFENWESEFLQMALFVLLTISLRQQGSSESNPLGEHTIDSSQLKPKPDSPWPVKKGGAWLQLYKHSLSLSLIVLYLVSFVLHAYGSWLDFNEKQLLEHKPAIPFLDYADHAKLWFESFQNWQSEFLSVFAIIFLSIYLRELGSSQSKAVNAPHRQTGE